MSEFLVDLASLAEHPRGAGVVGGKARNLAALRAAGLTVPSGFVLLAGTAAVWSQSTQAARRRLERALQALAPRVVVRSSAAIEDGGNGGAAGVFLSVRDVTANAAEVAAAASQVVSSAQTDAAVMYARARGVDDAGMSVLVQQQIAGMCGVLYSRLPGDPDSELVIIEFEHDGQTHSLRVPRSTMTPRDDMAPLGDVAVTAILRAGLAAEAALDIAGGVDVEWVWDGAQVWVVQARAIHHPQPITRYECDPSLLAFSREQPALRWSLDATHNPEPLSLAQQGLVARADALGAAPYRMRCVGGYLYTCPAPSPQHIRPSSNDADRARVPPRLSEFEQHLALLTREAEAALAPLEAEHVPSLDEALRAYDHVYAIYAGRISPFIASARAALAAEADTVDGAKMHVLTRARGALLGALDDAAAGTITFEALLDLAGPVAQAWDVAAPTYAEEPQVLRAAVKGLAEAPPAVSPHRPSHPAHHPAQPSRLDTLGTRIGAAAEDDDLLFWRAQAGVRRALRHAARRVGLAADDVFHVALERVCVWDAEGATAPATAHTDADAARRAQARQRMVSMPEEFCAGVPCQMPTTTSSHAWRGVGTGGAAHGYVWRVENASDLTCAPAGTIVVARTASPATALVARSARALVFEHGGLLSHGAALARELGIPCVVGCPGVWSALAAGDHVWVSGHHGRVIRLR